MKRIGLIAIFLLTAFAVTGTAQEHFTEGPVARVTLVDIKPGKGGDFWRDLRQNLKPVWEEFKKAGIITNYGVSTKSTVDEPGDWDVAIVLEYKNWAGLDGLAARTDPITLKAYGSAEARTAAAVKRTEYGTVVSSFLMRNVTLKDLAK